MTEPATAEKATVWFAKADIIKKLSNDMDEKIVQLKEKLDIDKKRQGETKIVRNLFTDETKKQLNNELESYRKNMLEVDPEIKDQFRNTFAFLKVTDEFRTSTYIKCFVTSVGYS